jgi:hypothetical protein
MEHQFTREVVAGNGPLALRQATMLQQQQDEKRRAEAEAARQAASAEKKKSDDDAREKAETDRQRLAMKRLLAAETAKKGERGGQSRARPCRMPNMPHSGNQRWRPTFFRSLGRRGETLWRCSPPAGECSRVSRSDRVPPAAAAETRQPSSTHVSFVDCTKRPRTRKSEKYRQWTGNIEFSGRL